MKSKSKHGTVAHATEIDLELGLEEVLASPKEVGQLEAIFVRPATNERSTLRAAKITTASGIAGDRWVHDAYYRRKDGSPDRRAQVSLMNFHFLRQIAGSDEAMCLAGDSTCAPNRRSESHRRRRRNRIGREDATPNRACCS